MMDGRIRQHCASQKISDTHPQGPGKSGGRLGNIDAAFDPADARTGSAAKYHTQSVWVPFHKIEIEGGDRRDAVFDPRPCECQRA